MIKSKLIASISDKIPHLAERTIAQGVNKIIDMMSEALYNNKRIEIRGFGSFSVKHYLPRNAHNPRTGEKVTTTEKYSPHFKPGKALREAINLSRLHTPIRETDDQS